MPATPTDVTFAPAPAVAVPDPEWSGRDTVALTVLAVVGAGWVMAGTMAGTPVLGRTWSWWGLVGVAGVATTLFAARRLRSRRTGRKLLAAVGAAVVFTLLVGAFVWGVTHSVVVGGRVYLETSETARSYRMASQLAEDRRYFAQVDELLGLDPATARTRFRELEPAQRNMEAISDRWNLVDAGDLPDGAFAPLVENARTAAYFGAQALERKSQLLGVQDDKVAAELETYRTTFVNAASALGPQLAGVAQDKGFDLRALDAGK